MKIDEHHQAERDLLTGGISYIIVIILYLLREDHTSHNASVSYELKKKNSKNQGSAVQLVTERTS